MEDTNFSISFQKASRTPQMMNRVKGLMWMRQV